MGDLVFSESTLRLIRLAGILFIGAMVFLMVSKVLPGLRRRSANKQSPLVTIPVVLIEKRLNNDYSDSGFKSNTHYQATKTQYYLTFKTEDGNPISFNVRANEFAGLQEGQKGSLSYQGSKFVDFK